MRIAIHNQAKSLRNGLRNAKEYPYMDELILLLKEQGFEIKLIEGALSWKQMHDILKWCDTWIGIDSFWQHFAWFYKKYGIVLFGQSDPRIFGHPENINLLKDRSYLRANQHDIWESATYNQEAFISPAEIINRITL